MYTFSNLKSKMSNNSRIVRVRFVLFWRHFPHEKGFNGWPRIGRQGRNACFEELLSCEIPGSQGQRARITTCTMAWRRRLSKTPFQEGTAPTRGSHWLQCYTLAVPCPTHIAAKPK